MIPGPLKRFPNPPRILASPRRRRRLAWLASLVAVAAIVAAVVAEAPNVRGDGKQTAPTPPDVYSSRTTTTFGPPPDAATERARRRAEAAVRPLAEQFLTALQRRRDLDRASSLLAPALRSRTTLADWRAGRHLPVSVPADATYSGTTVAFSGRTLVGLVVSFTPHEAEADSALYALRFRKLDRRWLVDYVAQGHSSRLVDATTFAPAGFLPGTEKTSGWSWLVLAFGLAALIAAVAFVDWMFLRRRARG